MAKLTEAQLETAARAYCERLGLDPDRILPHGAEPDERGFVPAVCLYSPQWRLAVAHVRRAEAMEHALAAGRAALASSTVPDERKGGADADA